MPPFCWRLELSWLGTSFVGWQRQARGSSVQGEVERAASAILGGETVTVKATGRTDAGVHAAQQFAVLRCHTPRSAAELRDGLNHLLPPDIVALDVQPAPADFDPRRWTRSKLYRYRWLVRRIPCPFRRDRTLLWRRRLDPAAMHEAAQALVGRHDFSSFRATGCAAHNPVRKLVAISVAPDADEVRLDVQGNGFLRHQVRIIAGTLAEVGRGAWPVDRVAQALAAARRDAAGPTAPAHGLWLMAVELGPGPRAD